jgi:hypothetical protein
MPAEFTGMARTAVSATFPRDSAAVSRFVIRAALITLATIPLDAQIGVNTFTGGPPNMVQAQGVALGFVGGVV